jgi:hypothetical protein
MSPERLSVGPVLLLELSKWKKSIPEFRVEELAKIIKKHEKCIRKLSKIYENMIQNRSRINFGPVSTPNACQVGPGTHPVRTGRSFLEPFGSKMSPKWSLWGPLLALKIN